MSTFTVQTTGTLVQVVAKSRLTKSELRTLLQKSGFEVQTGDAGNKEELVRGPLDTARKAAAEGDDSQHRALLDFTRFFVVALSPNDRRLLPALNAALTSNGFDLHMEPTGGFDDEVTCRILPMEPGAVALEPEITALEVELQGRGYTVAAAAYRDAVDCHADLRFSPANSAIRAVMESLVTELAVDHAGYVRPPHTNTGREAIKRLIDAQSGSKTTTLGQPLPLGDGGEMLRGIWSILHTNGCHPGTSDAQESRLRIQLVTGLAQFLLRHFPA